MSPLKIEEFRRGFGVRTMRISGLTDDEMKELSSMEYREMKDVALDLLNSRNGNLGTCWHNGYGVYNVYIHPMYKDSLFIEIGTSCD